MLLETLVVLLQPNTAGKSYSLDALQLLSETATPSRKLPILCYCWNGVLKPKDLIKRERLTFSIEVDLRLRDTVVDAVKRRIRGMRRLSGDAPSGDRRPRGCANAICATGRDRIAYLPVVVANYWKVFSGDRHLLTDAD